MSESDWRGALWAGAVRLEPDTRGAFGRGGFGVVYRLKGPHGPALCVKLLHKGLRTEWQAHVEKLVNAGQPMAGLAWPKKTVSDADGFAGYLMAVFDQARYRKLIEILGEPRSEPGLDADSDPAFRLALASGLARLVAGVHRAGYVIRDLKPDNILVDTEALRNERLEAIALVDCDSFARSEDNNAPPINPNDSFKAPELASSNPPPLGQAQDLFSLAVLIFKILNNSVHPFDYVADRSESPVDQYLERARRQWFVYGRSVSTKLPFLRPHPRSFDAAWSDNLRDGFERAFTGRSGDRPTAEQWSTLLPQTLRYARRADSEHRRAAEPMPPSDPLPATALISPQAVGVQPSGDVRMPATNGQAALPAAVSAKAPRATAIRVSCIAAGIVILLAGGWVAIEHAPLIQNIAGQEEIACGPFSDNQPESINIGAFSVFIERVGQPQPVTEDQIPPGLRGQLPRCSSLSLQRPSTMTLDRFLSTSGFRAEDGSLSVGQTINSSDTALVIYCNSSPRWSRNPTHSAISIDLRISDQRDPLPPGPLGIELQAPEPHNFAWLNAPSCRVNPRSPSPPLLHGWRVRAIDPGSPAHGTLEVGDLLLDTGFLVEVRLEGFTGLLRSRPAWLDRTPSPNDPIRMRVAREGHRSPLHLSIPASR